MLDPESVARKALNKKKVDYATVTSSNDNYDIDREVDPIQTDTSDSKYLFDNENAVVINFKKNKKK